MTTTETAPQEQRSEQTPTQTPKKPEARVALAGGPAVQANSLPDCVSPEFGGISPVPPALKAAQQAEAVRRGSRRGSTPPETEFTD